VGAATGFEEPDPILRGVGSFNGCFGRFGIPKLLKFEVPDDAEVITHFT
jgi:hypothetical protein